MADLRARTGRGDVGAALELRTLLERHGEPGDGTACWWSWSGRFVRVDERTVVGSALAAGPWGIFRFDRPRRVPVTHEGLKPHWITELRHAVASAYAKADLWQATLLGLLGEEEAGKMHAWLSSKSVWRKLQPPTSLAARVEGIPRIQTSALVPGRRSILKHHKPELDEVLRAEADWEGWGLPDRLLAAAAIGCQRPTSFAPLPEMKARK